jgi:hypothetical protein
MPEHGWYKCYVNSLSIGKVIGRVHSTPRGNDVFSFVDKRGWSATVPTANMLEPVRFHLSHIQQHLELNHGTNKNNQNHRTQAQ